MRIAVFGSGGREHALCWRLTQDREPHQVTCIPGNSAIGKIVQREPMQNNLFDLARSLSGRFDLAIIGPERLLADGFADRLREVGIPTFGPSAMAAKIESSKFYMHGLADRCGVETARWIVSSHIDTARNAVGKLNGPPIVLKADGLAAGKGVFVADTEAEVDEALRALFVERRFGDEASQIVVIEEKLEGVEVSATALCSDTKVLPMACAMDYKQRDAGDKGPNTGGVGAHSPSFVLTPEMEAHVLARVLQPLADGLAREGRPFRGALYAGLMVSHDRKSIKMLECNARFGDPECQVLMMRLAEDLAPRLLDAACGKLSDLPLKFTDDVVVNTVLFSRPYPDQPVVGELISGIGEAEKVPGVTIFHAGTTLQHCGTYVTTGGRVLSVCARGKTLEEARGNALRAADLVSWKNKTLRRDIGWRVLQKA